MTRTEPLLSAINGVVVNGFGGGDISFELADALRLTPVKTSLPGLSRADLLVLAWLKKHANAIATKEQHYRIDRRAIAGAVAWEALKNVRSDPWDGLGRAIGPGKVHYSTERTWGEGDPVSRQVETAGYLPRVTMEKRRQLLRSADGSFDYMAAIFAALADVAAQHGYNVRCDPIILTNAYQGEDLKSWREDLAKKRPSDPLRPGNPMALWIKNRISYLEEGVGKHDPRICTPPFVGPK